MSFNPKMTSSFRQSIIFYILLCFANILAGIFNQLHNHTGSLEDLIESMPGLVIISFIFWLGCQWKPQSKLRFFFLPVLRSIFWIILVVSGFMNNNRLISEDFLYTINNLFFWWTSLKILTPTLRINHEFVELFLVDIIGVAIGQMILIYITVLLDRKFVRLSNHKIKSIL